MRRQAELLATETATTQAIIQSLLEFLRARPAERHPTALRPLVDAVLLLHAYRLASGPIEVVVDVADSVPAVPLDRAGIQLVLINLVQDAVDALYARGEPGRLEILAVPAGVSVRVMLMHDAGAPPSDSPERERAWRVSNAIVADHGGALARTVEGSTITLPVAGASAAEPAAAAPLAPDAPAPGSPVRVLVLDDERSIGM